MMKQNKFKRLWQHCLHPRFRVAKYFPAGDLQRISRQINASEQKHQGQIRFVVESSLPAAAVLKNLDTRTRALQWFGELGVWDTEKNCGVLVYVSFADHAVEVVADRGINQKVDGAVWQRVCEIMRTDFQKGSFVAGLEKGLAEVDDILSSHFPRGSDIAGPGNELSDEVVLH